MRKHKRMTIVSISLIGILLLVSCSSSVKEVTEEVEAVEETENAAVEEKIEVDNYYPDEEIIAGWYSSMLLQDTIMMSSIDDDDMVILVPIWVDILATAADVPAWEDYGEEEYESLLGKIKPLSYLNSNNISKDTYTKFTFASDINVSIQSLPENALLGIGAVEETASLTISEIPEGTAIHILKNFNIITLASTVSGSGSLIIGVNEGKIFINNNTGYVNILKNKGEVYVSENEGLILIGTNTKDGKILIGNYGVESIFGNTEWIKVANNSGTIEIGQSTNNKKAFTEGNNDEIYITNNKMGAKIKIFSNDDDIYIEQNWGEVDVGAQYSEDLKGSNNDRVFIEWNKKEGVVINLDLSDVRIRNGLGDYIVP